jgi:hypothetical protein
MRHARRNSVRELDRLIAAVQRNCDIADARHARDATLCTYLLQMRERYCWECNLPLAAQPPREDLSRWLTAREAAWVALEDAAFEPLPLGERSFDPFDAGALNETLLAHGRVYGAGYGRFQRPHFFIADLESCDTRDGIRVLIAGREHARDLAAPPAALQGDTIFLRRDALRRWLWDKVDLWRMKRSDGALSRAMTIWGLQEGDDVDGFERMVAAETESVLLHELGEARAGGLLGGRWEDMLAGLAERRAELLARAVRDNLADCLSTLPALLERDASASLHFYFSQFDGLRRELFPGLASAYREWHEAGRSTALHDTIGRGTAHWARIAADWIADPMRTSQAETRALML